MKLAKNIDCWWCLCIIYYFLFLNFIDHNIIIIILFLLFRYLQLLILAILSLLNHQLILVYLLAWMLVAPCMGKLHTWMSLPSSIFHILKLVVLHSQILLIIPLREVLYFIIKFTILVYDRSYSSRRLSPSLHNFLLIL